MASIQNYLNDLEARLTPSLDAHTLQERLTEAEVHLRDRAQEFEEIGLPAPEAEARAVAAFGDVGEYVEDVPVVVLSTPVGTAGGERRDIALQLAWSALALGLLAALAVTFMPVVWAMFFAATVIGVSAFAGRATSLARLGTLSAFVALALFAVFAASYVPGPFLASPIPRATLNARVDLGRGPAAAKYASFRVLQTKALDGRLSKDANGRFPAPSNEGGRLIGYSSESKAVNAWRLYGAYGAVTLRNAAEREVGSRIGGAHLRCRGRNPAGSDVDGSPRRAPSDWDGHPERLSPFEPFPAPDEGVPHLRTVGKALRTFFGLWGEPMQNRQVHPCLRARQVP